MIKPAYKHYLKLPYWSNLEAVCLLSEICPMQYMEELPIIFRGEPLGSYYPCPQKIEMFKKFMRPIQIEFELSSTDSVVPIKAIEWAINKGFDVPVELKEFAKSKTTTAPPVQQDDAPKEKTSLLNTPKRQDEWFEVIHEMANEFHEKSGVLPTATQAWNLLCTQPPAGYMITTDKDKGEFCLIMAGCNPLGKKAFGERWRKYTK